MAGLILFTLARSILSNGASFVIIATESLIFWSPLKISPTRPQPHHKPWPYPSFSHRCQLQTLFPTLLDGNSLVFVHTYTKPNCADRTNFSVIVKFLVLPDVPFTLSNRQVRVSYTTAAGWAYRPVVFASYLLLPTTHLYLIIYC